MLNRVEKALQKTKERISFRIKVAMHIPKKKTKLKAINFITHIPMTYRDEHRAVTKVSERRRTSKPRKICYIGFETVTLRKI